MCQDDVDDSGGLFHCMSSLFQRVWSLFRERKEDIDNLWLGGVFFF